MERCTACRARLGASPICPRCGCDFTLAMRAETQAGRLLVRAILAMADGAPAMAQDFANQSLALKHGRLAEAVAAMLRASQGT